MWLALENDSEYQILWKSISDVLGGHKVACDTVLDTGTKILLNSHNKLHQFRKVVGQVIFRQNYFSLTCDSLLDF